MEKIYKLPVIFLMVFAIAGSVYAISPVALATDAGGTAKNVFPQEEDVYGIGRFGLVGYACSAVGEACSGSVDLYVVNDNTGWWIGDGSEVLVDVSDGVETVDVSGTCISAPVGLECLIQMPVEQIWAADTMPGKYDFIIDVGRDGVFNQQDPIDNAIVSGFSVLPEFTTIGAGLVLIGAGFYAWRKRK